MMPTLHSEAPLELPLPRRVETSTTNKIHSGLRKLITTATQAEAACAYDGMPAKLFVGGVSAHTSTEALRGHFAKYGRIIDAVVMQKNGRPRGFGFVTFDHHMPAECALAEAQWLDGRLVDVKRAVPGERAQERASNKIFVGGLPQDVSTEELRGYFSGYGAVADAVVMVDRRTNRSRGFGFVRFGNGVQGNAASEAVLMDFQCHRLAGKWVEVKRATPASQLQDMFDPEGFTEEQMYAMTADDLMAAAAMGMQLHDYMGMAGWDSSPCGESTPMSSMAGMEDSTAGSTKSHARGRRARRRKQREQNPGCEGEDYSDDGENQTPSFAMSETAHGEVAFISTSNACSTNTSPTAASTVDTPSAAVAPRFEARALGPIPSDRLSAMLAGAFPRQHGNGAAKHIGGSPTNDPENDPGRANAAKCMSMEQPMKVQQRRTEGYNQSLTAAAPVAGEGFTREDFLSLEVGTRDDFLNLEVGTGRSWHVL